MNSLFTSDPNDPTDISEDLLYILNRYPPTERAVWIERLRGYEILISAQLREVTDSDLIAKGCPKEVRYEILTLGSQISGRQMPFGGALIYALDVDGTLTPHIGRNPRSLYNQGGDEYYSRMLPSQRDAIIKFLLSLPSQPGSVIFITRSERDKVLRYLELLIDLRFMERVDLERSSFRDSGMYPIDRTGSKGPALNSLRTASRPVIYADDDLREVGLCPTVGNVDCVHIQKWLGDPLQAELFRVQAYGFYERYNPPKLVDESGYQERPISPMGRNSISPNRPAGINSIGRQGSWQSFQSQDSLGGSSTFDQRSPLLDSSGSNSFTPYGYSSSRLPTPSREVFGDVLSSSGSRSPPILNGSGRQNMSRSTGSYQLSPPRSPSINSYSPSASSSPRRISISTYN